MKNCIEKQKLSSVQFGCFDEEFDVKSSLADLIISAQQYGDLIGWDSYVGSGSTPAVRS